MKRIARSTLQTTINLVFFAAVGTSILSATFYLTRDTIVRTEAEAKLKLITQMVPPSLFDNDIMQDRLVVPPNELLGTDEPTVAYRARLAGRPTAVVLDAVAPDGYSGRIAMVVAVRPNGELLGVRVVAHQETPGLGDYIDFAKSPWIKTFDGKSRKTSKDSDWRVKKDGGMFDYMAGATISPRAVVKAVNKALVFFDKNRDTLFAQQGAPEKEKRK